MADFFKSIISPSSPENLQRQAMRKIEADLKEDSPLLYKNGLVQPVFAETLRILYENTAPIMDILCDTFCSTDLDTSRRFEEQLLFTGFDPEACEIIGSMEFNRRKERAKDAENLNRHFEAEHKELEKVVKQLNSQEFIKIDQTFDKLKQLSDVCKYSYMTALKLFDPNFSTAPSYTPSFQALPPELLENSLQDLYFVFAELDITTAVFNAIVALAKLKNGNVSDMEAARLKDNLQKIQSIAKNHFTKKALMLLIRLAKKNHDYIPERAIYNGAVRQKYADYLESRFRVDETRLKGEIQDERIGDEIKKVFSGEPLTSLKGYTKETDAVLRQSTPCSFVWIMPLQLLKNFFTKFYAEHVKPLLNDIVIEGYFNNAAYKSEFSGSVFTCNDSLERIEAFEAKFDRGKEFDEANITSLVRDSHKDPSFESTLKIMVEKINKEAKELVQAETTNVLQLYKKISDILVESKKPASDVITNLKVLMISSRNRENSDIMESQNGKWKIFLEIMKNYVIIGSIEKK